MIRHNLIDSTYVKFPVSLIENNMFKMMVAPKHKGLIWFNWGRMGWEVWITLRLHYLSNLIACWGPFIYYVIQIWGPERPPSHVISNKYGTFVANVRNSSCATAVKPGIYGLAFTMRNRFLTDNSATVGRILMIFFAPKYFGISPKEY